MSNSGQRWWPWRRGASGGGKRGDAAAEDSRLDSRLGGVGFGASSMLGSSFAASSLWADSRLAGTGPGADNAQRWLRQFHASRSWAGWGAALGAVVGLLLFAPAQWLATAVQNASEGRLLLAEAQGSVWDGSAVPVLSAGPDSRDASAPPGRLYWRLRAGWQGLRMELRQPCCIHEVLRLQVQPRWGQLSLRFAPEGAAAADMGRWPTALLDGLGAPWNTLELRGLMHLSSPGMTLHLASRGLRLEGGLRVELRGVSSRMSPLPVLGSYRVDLQGLPGGAEGLRLHLQTLDGVLLLSGDGQLSGPRLRFRGQAQAAPGQEAALSNLLNIIGRRQGAQSAISIG